jgi:dsDNA-binding SOS-regulon protein
MRKSTLDRMRDEAERLDEWLQREAKRYETKTEPARHALATLRTAIATLDDSAPRAEAVSWEERERLAQMAASEPAPEGDAPIREGR